MLQTLTRLCSVRNPSLDKEQGTSELLAKRTLRGAQVANGQAVEATMTTGTSIQGFSII